MPHVPRSVREGADASRPPLPRGGGCLTSHARSERGRMPHVPRSVREGADASRPTLGPRGGRCLTSPARSERGRMPHVPRSVREGADASRPPLVREGADASRPTLGQRGDGCLTSPARSERERMAHVPRSDQDRAQLRGARTLVGNTRALSPPAGPSPGWSRSVFPQIQVRSGSRTRRGRAWNSEKRPPGDQWGTPFTATRSEQVPVMK